MKAKAMNEFGVMGGWDLAVLPSRAYMRSFFLAFEKYPLTVELYRKLDWSLIMDRLYRRIIPDEQLDVAIGIMMRMLGLLGETKMADVDWAAIGLEGPEDGPEGLGPDATLWDFYMPFVRAVERCATSIVFGRVDGARTPSLRLACLDTGPHLFFEDFPAEEYEKLTGDPLWLRDDLEFPKVNIETLDGGRSPIIGAKSAEQTAQLSTRFTSSSKHPSAG